MNTTDMTHDEKSLLLYFESCAVDKSGKIDPLKMNAVDNQIAERWHASGFVRSGRICFKDITPNGGSQWCHLSDEAHTTAAQLRKERAERGWAQRTYRTTEEKNQA